MWKDTEKDEIVPHRVDTVSKVSCGGSSGTETVREQWCDLEYHLGEAPEDLTENPFHQRLIWIMHEGGKGGIPTLRSRDITLLTKHLNEKSKNF